MNKKLVFIIAIICLALGSIATYFVTKESFKCPECKETKCEEVEKEEITTKEIFKNEDSKTYESLLSIIKDTSNLEYLDKNFKVEDLTNSEMLRFSINFIEERYDREFTLNEINKVSLKYFGRRVEGEDIPCPVENNVLLFIYDKETKLFKLNKSHGGHGGSGIYSPIVLNRIINIENENNIYTVKVKKAFSLQLNDIGIEEEYYKTYGDAFNSNNPVFNITAEEIEKDEFIAETKFNKLPENKLLTYTYVFEKKDDSFILKSYTFK